MCQFFSGIVTNKNRKLIWDYDFDSHTELLEKHKIKDETNSPEFVRVELLPPDGDIWNHDLTKWVFRVDQDFKPEWFDKDQTAEMMRKALKQLIDERFVIDRKLKEITSGRWFLKNAKVEKISGSSILKVAINSQVGVLRENSQVGVLRENSQVGELRGNSQVGELWGNSKILRHFSSYKKSKINDQAMIIYPNEKKIVMADPDFKIEVVGA